MRWKIFVGSQFVVTNSSEGTVLKYLEKVQSIHVEVGAGAGFTLKRK